MPRDDYEEIWSDLEPVIRRHAAEQGRLSPALRLAEAEWRQMDASPADGVSFGKAVNLPRAALFGGRQALRSRVIVEQCRPDTDLIVELASGWGINLFDAYLSGAPANARFAALEFTVSGRSASEVLAALEPEMRFEARAFDFYTPDYRGLSAEHAVVFSSHGIEQIPELPEEAITGLLDIGKKVTGIHFEPVGWQTGAASQVGATKARAEAVAYNRNLWPLLKRLENQGRIAIDTMIADIFHHKRKNASTLIVWRKV